MIRKLENSDINRIMDIWINTTIKAHSFVKQEYWMENYDIVKNTYLPSSDTYIYEDNEDIKGFISVIDNEFIGALFIDYKYQGYYDIVKNTYLPSSDTYIYEDNEDIKGFISVIDNEFIGALFIDYKYQGYGIGKKLIDYISGIYTKLALTVYKDNYRAVQFYKQMGFKVIDEMCNEDTKCIEYLMKK